MMSETQYYIAKPGGEPAGPYTLSALESMAAAHELSLEHIYCVKGMPEWLPITRIVDLPGAAPANDILSPIPVNNGPPLSPVPPLPTYQNEPKSNTHLAGSIVVLALAFIVFILTIPFAITALVQSIRAEYAWVDRMNAESRRLSSSAGFWVKFSVITIILQILLVVGGCLYLVAELERGY